MLKQEMALKDLTAVSLRQLLENLAEARARRESGEDVELPAMTIHLRSGATVQGWLLRFAQQGSSGFQLLVHVNSGDPRQPGTSVCFVELSAIEALTVHEAGFFTSLLSAGKAKRVPSGPAPSILDLKRKAQTIGKDLAVLGVVIAVDADWTTLPMDDASCFAIDETLNDLASLLKRISEDLRGRDSLEKLKRIELRTGEAFQAVASDSVLKVTLQQSSNGDLIAPDRAELSKAVESSL